MRLLTEHEADKQKASARFETLIKGVIDAHAKALFDFVEEKGYKNTYTSKAQLVAYQIGWNKCAKIFPRNAKAQMQ